MFQVSYLGLLVRGRGRTEYMVQTPYVFYIIVRRQPPCILLIKAVLYFINNKLVLNLFCFCVRNPKHCKTKQGDMKCGNCIWADPFRHVRYVRHTVYDGLWMVMTDYGWSWHRVIHHNMLNSNICRCGAHSPTWRTSPVHGQVWYSYLIVARQRSS